MKKVILRILVPGLLNLRERAGRVRYVWGNDNREGAITAIGAVSPPEAIFPAGHTGYIAYC